MVAIAMRMSDEGYARGQTRATRERWWNVCIIGTTDMHVAREFVNVWL